MILPADTLCSAIDETHDAAMKIYKMRFSAQVTLTSAAEALESWRD